MGYYKEEKMKEVIIKMEEGLEKSMDIIDTSKGFIDTWLFDEGGNIELFQDLQCGCKKVVGYIKLDIPIEELEVIQEEEFIMQIEEMLLQVNDSKGYENLLFNIGDTLSFRAECENCRDLYTILQ